MHWFRRCTRAGAPHPVVLAPSSRKPATRENPNPDSNTHESAHDADASRLEFELESVWKDGTRPILLSPEDLLVRLIAAIPPPRFLTTTNRQ